MLSLVNTVATSQSSPSSLGSVTRNTTSVRRQADSAVSAAVTEVPRVK